MKRRMVVLMLLALGACVCNGQWVFLRSAGLDTAPGEPNVPTDVGYFVDPSGGSNGNTGTSTLDAWATVEYAEEHAANGSTVYLMDGDYGTITIDRAGGRTSWTQAVTFSPASGATPDIDMVRVNGTGLDRYLIFDGLTVTHPDTLGVTNNDDVFIIQSSYVQLTDCTVFGFLGTGNRYPEDDRYTQEATTVGAVLIQGTHVTLDGCTIACSLFGVDIENDVENTAIVVQNCRIGFTPGQAIQIAGPPRPASAILIDNNVIEHKIDAASANYTRYVHGTAILLWCDGATITNNVIRGYGHDGSIRGALHAADGSYQFSGTITSGTFTIGDLVTQGAVTGMYTGTRGTAPYYVFATEHEEDAFITGVTITGTSGTFMPATFEGSSQWGGMQELKIRNNLIYHGFTGGGAIHIYEIGPGTEIVNNTLVGHHDSDTRTGPTYFETAISLGLPPYYGDMTDLVISNNIFAGLSALAGADGHVVPDGAVLTGNVIWCTYDYSGAGTQTYCSQTEMDAVAPGNTVYCWSVTNDAVSTFTTAGNTFVGGTWFDTWAFAPVVKTDGYNLPGYGIVNDAFFVNVEVNDMGHVFDLAAGSDAIGYADPATATATDLWGRARDGDPDTGADEYGN